MARQEMFAQENVYFTDCILRHMHQYRFLTHFDPDEVPILPRHDNFTHFLDDLIARCVRLSIGEWLRYRCSLHAHDEMCIVLLLAH